MADGNQPVILRDGGKAALAGFLYQMLMVSGLRAMTLIPQERESGGEEEFLLQAIADGSLKSEELGQDAVVEIMKGVEQGKLVVIQAKYSSQDRPADIADDEFKKIIGRMLVAKELAAQNGQEISRYTIITNRGFGSHVEGWLSGENQLPSFDPLEKLAEAKDIVDSLIQIMPAKQSSWEGAITAYGNQFGLNFHEIKEGISLIVSKLFQAAASGTCLNVDEHFLKNSFVGNSNARTLDVTTLKKEFPPDLFDAFFQRNRDEFCPIVRRESTEKKLSKAIDDRRHLILLVGDGGNGKSIAVAEWLYHQSATMEEMIVVPFHAANIVSNQVQKTIKTWTRLGRGLLDNKTEAELVDRIITASDRHIIFCLIIDGLDEALENKEAMNLLNMFWGNDRHRQPGEQPKVMLIATCRDEQWVKNSLFLDDGIRGSIPGPEIIPIGNFSHDELLIVANEKLDRNVFDKLRGILQGTTPVDELDSVPMTLDDSIAGVVETTIEEKKIIDALHHPVIWGCFSETLNSTDQIAILAAKHESINLLAKKILTWFQTKLNRRTSNVYLDYDLFKIFQNAASLAPYKKYNNNDTIWAKGWLCCEYYYVAGFTIKD